MTSQKKYFSQKKGLIFFNSMVTAFAEKIDRLLLDVKMYPTAFPEEILICIAQRPGDVMKLVIYTIKPKFLLNSDCIGYVRNNYDGYAQLSKLNGVPVSNIRLYIEEKIREIIA